LSIAAQDQRGERSKPEFFSCVFGNPLGKILSKKCAPTSWGPAREGISPFNHLTEPIKNRKGFHHHRKPQTKNRHGFFSRRSRFRFGGVFNNNMTNLPEYSILNHSVALPFLLRQQKSLTEKRMGNTFCPPMVAMAALQDEKKPFYGYEKSFWMTAIAMNKVHESRSTMPGTSATLGEEENHMATDHGLLPTKRTNSDSSSKRKMPKLTIVTDFSSEETESCNKTTVDQAENDNSSTTTRYQKFNFQIDDVSCGSILVGANNDDIEDDDDKRRQYVFSQPIPCRQKRRSHQLQQRGPRMKTTTRKRLLPFCFSTNGLNHCDKSERCEGNSWIIFVNRSCNNVPDDISVITCRSEDFVVPL
jgi:hypothetical protein